MAQSARATRRRDLALVTATAPRPAAWAPCHVDDLAPLVNLAQAADLAAILEMTPARRRCAVAMAFAGLQGVTDLAVALGLAPPGTAPDAAECAALRRWLAYENRMPMGIAFRLERIFGVPARVLCEAYG